MRYLPSSQLRLCLICTAAGAAIACGPEVTTPNAPPARISEAKAIVPLPSMAGETFSAMTRVGAGDEPGEVRVTAFSCTANSASVSFVATGPAAGPYPGTFTETGTITAGPPDVDGNRFTTSFDAEYEIRSSTGRVTGTKIQTGPGAFICNQSGIGQVSVGSVLTVYQAHIRFRGTRCFDAGTARTEFGHFPGDVTSFAELFINGNDPTSCHRGNRQ